MSNIIIEMALSPKSNTAYLALDKAITDIETKNIGEIPSYLKVHISDINILIVIGTLLLIKLIFQKI